MKICNWKRFITFLVTLIALIILITVLILTNKTHKLSGTQEYTIQSGETLWSIASTFRPSTMSIQEYIYNLQQFNQINSTIYPEQTIQILIYEEV